MPGFSAPNAAARYTAPAGINANWHTRRAGLLLVAVGIVFFWLLILNSLQWVPMWFFEAWTVVLQTCVFALVGAGLGAPIKKKTTGAVIGATVSLLMLLLIHLPSRGR